MIDLRFKFSYNTFMLIRLSVNPYFGGFFRPDHDPPGVVF